MDTDQPGYRHRQAPGHLVDKAADEIREADLTHHLKNGDDAAKAPAAAPTVDPNTPEEKLGTSDYELHEALNLLNGLAMQRGLSPITAVLVPWAEGCVEIAAATVIDLLRGLEAGPVTASRGVRLLPDITSSPARHPPIV